MLEVDLKYLGQQILAARKSCGLTQRELAAQTRLAVKTIQDIEGGNKNPTYDTLSRLIARLGVSADVLFNHEAMSNDNELRPFIRKFHVCSPKNQQILLQVINFLSDLLLVEQHRQPDDAEIK